MTYMPSQITGSIHVISACQLFWLLRLYILVLAVLGLPLSERLNRLVRPASLFTFGRNESRA